MTLEHLAPDHPGADHRTEQKTRADQTLCLFPQLFIVQLRHIHLYGGGLLFILLFLAHSLGPQLVTPPDGILIAQTSLGDVERAQQQFPEQEQHHEKPEGGLRLLLQA